MSAQAIEIALYTADGFTGTYKVHVTEQGDILRADAISWDGDPDEHTIDAEIGEIQISGDVWRTLEDEGSLDEAIRAVARGEAKTAADIEAIATAQRKANFGR